MTRAIWKYTVDRLGAPFVIDMPRGAEVLCVQDQDDCGCIWALVDAGAGLEARTFIVHGTGHPLVEAATADRYVGTYQQRGGTLVFHLFDLSPTPDPQSKEPGR